MSTDVASLADEYQASVKEIAALEERQRKNETEAKEIAAALAHHRSNQGSLNRLLQRLEGGAAALRERRERERPEHDQRRPATAKPADATPVARPAYSGFGSSATTAEDKPAEGKARSKPSA